MYPYNFPPYWTTHINTAAAKPLQSCPTLCDPTDGSPRGSTIPGTLQARTLEWVAISFSNVWKWKVKVKSLSRVWLFMIAWTAAYQAPPSMGFSRQECWSGLSLPSPYIYILLLLSHVSHVWLCATPWTAAYQAPLSMGFSRQEYWSGLLLPIILNESKQKKYDYISTIPSFWKSAKQCQSFVNYNTASNCYVHN